MKLVKKILKKKVLEDKIIQNGILHSFNKLVILKEII